MLLINTKRLLLLLIELMDHDIVTVWFINNFDLQKKIKISICYARKKREAILSEKIFSVFFFIIVYRECVNEDVKYSIDKLFTAKKFIFDDV